MRFDWLCGRLAKEAYHRYQYDITPLYAVEIKTFSACYQIFPNLSQAQCELSNKTKRKTTRKEKSADSAKRKKN